MIKKKPLLLFLLSSFLFGEKLADILSKNNQNILEYNQEKVEAESDKLSKSWISPITVSYSKNYTTQFGDTINTKNLSISVSQPIFRSGGIYYAIKYARELRKANTLEVELRKREMITNAVSTLYTIEQNKLQQQKIAYQLKNDAIDIMQKQESYNSGLIDSSFLDQAILKKSQDQITQLELEVGRLTLEQQFALLSDKKPETLKLPIFSLISKETYRQSNLELQKDKYDAEVARYNQYMTWAKYLPAVSFQGQYTDGDINPLFGGSNPFLKEKYNTWAIAVSMPIDINSFSDIESSRVSRLQSEIEVIERKKTVDLEYSFSQKNLEILDKKITLAHKDEKVYASLYALTSNLAKAGEKTPFDAEVMHNTMQIRKLDAKIYEIDKQIQLLKLYAKINRDF